MLVREEVVFAAHVGHLQESQALSSERLGSPALYFPVQSDPLERGYRLCARACLITADLYTTIGMVSYNRLLLTIIRRSLRKIEELLHCIEVRYNQLFHILSRSFALELSHTRSDQEHHRVRFSPFIILDRFRITRDDFLNNRL